MRRHVVMMHGSHLCSECDYVGESRPALMQHMAAAHPLVCQRCGLEVHSPEQLKTHLCSMAPNVRADPTGMNPAKTKRNRLRLSTCDIPGCSVVFSDRKALRQHKKEVHGREAQVREKYLVYYELRISLIHHLLFLSGRFPARSAASTSQTTPS